MKAWLVLLFMSIAAPVLAQQPVTQWADWASYGSAAVTPAAAAWAARHDKCRLAQIAVSELVGNAATVAIKHFVVSPRPCVGCKPDGSPSGHSMNATIGVSRVRYGLMFSVGTMQLRREANRHTLAQVLQGFAVGIGAEASGYLIRCQE